MSHPEAWKIRATAWQVTVTVATIAATLWLLYALRLVLLLLAFTVIFSYLLLPLVDAIEAPGRRWGWERRLPRTAAILLVYALLLAGLILAFERIVPLLADQISAFLDNLPVYARRFDQSIKWLASLPGRYRLPFTWRETLAGIVNAAPLRLLEWLQMIASRTLQLSLYVPWLLLIPIIGFFFLKDAATFNRQLLASFPEADMRHRIALFLQDVSQTLASYIRAQTIACVLVGGIEGAGLWLMGISYPLIIAIAAGLLEFIPVVGPFLLAVGAVMVASFSSWKFAAAVAAFLGIFRLIHDYIIYPRLVSEGLNIHPVIVILAVVSGAELGGVVGVFLGVPLAALLLVCWRHWRDLSLDRAGHEVKPS